MTVSGITTSLLYEVTGPRARRVGRPPLGTNGPWQRRAVGAFHGFGGLLRSTAGKRRGPSATLSAMVHLRTVIRPAYGPGDEASPRRPMADPLYVL